LAGSVGANYITTFHYYIRRCGQKYGAASVGQCDHLLS
jgi:hypothetical protein